MIFGIKTEESAIKKIRKGGHFLDKEFDDFRYKRSFIEKVVQVDDTAMQYLPDEMRDDKALGLLSVKKYGWTLGYLSPRLRDNEYVVLAAIGETSAAIQFASDRIKGNKAIVLSAIKDNGLNIEYAAEHFKDDPEIVLSAIYYEKSLFDQASPRLQKICENKDPIETLEKVIKIEKISHKMANQSRKKEATHKTFRI